MNNRNINRANNLEEQPQYKDFLRLLMDNRNRILGFIMALVGNLSDAEDIMQETTIVMWEKFAEFKLGTNFASWGMSIARYKAIQYLDQKHDKHVTFSPDAIENLVSCSNVFNDSEVQIKALKECVGKLDAHQQNIIRMRYTQKYKIKEIAQKTSRPLQGMYKAIARLHHSLYKCIERTLAEWEMA